MRLSEMFNELNSPVQSVIKRVLDILDDPVTINTTAQLLGVTERHVYFLCDTEKLDFLSHPYKKIFKKSILRLILKRHNLGHIEVDITSSFDLYQAQKIFK